MADSKNQPEALLVALDFSPCSIRALDVALAWRSATAEVTVLHVIDTTLLDQIDGLGLGNRDDALARLRTRADDNLAQLLAERAAERVESMIVVGEPFVEIAKIANDLECDLVVLGIHGTGSRIKELLFGGTAEKLLRASSRPVLCVP
jgi:nucleotide-binding universal stress UspA family protein